MKIQELIAEIQKKPSDFVYSVPDVFNTCHTQMNQSDAISKLEGIDLFWIKDKGYVDFSISGPGTVRFWNVKKLEHEYRTCFVIGISNEKIRSMKIW